MRHLSSSLVLASALCVFVLAPEAEAKLRGHVDVVKDVGPATVRVRLQTPDTVIHHRRPAPVRVREHWGHVSRVDRGIIHRLSIVTGIPERPMLRQRAQGLSWNRIARVNGISRQELRIARSPQRFRVWVAAEYGHYGPGGRHHGPYDERPWIGHCDD